MVEAIIKELEEEEAEGQEEDVTEEATEEQEEQPDAVEEPAEQEETEDERLKKQEAYKERQRQKQEERQRQLQEQAQKAVEQTEEKEGPSEVEQFIQRQIFEDKIQQAGRELATLETEFKDAFSDYDQQVEDALEISKIRLVSQGYTEDEAARYLQREKVLLADRAAARGLDPVEAIYKEAKSINSTYEVFAQKKGWVKADNSKPKTNLQALREINKPNAMTGGAGKGAVAAKNTFDEMEDMDEIDNVSIGQLLRGDV